MFVGGVGRCTRFPEGSRRACYLMVTLDVRGETGALCIPRQACHLTRPARSPCLWHATTFLCHSQSDKQCFRASWGLRASCSVSHVDHWSRVLWVASGPGSVLADFGRLFTFRTFQNGRGGLGSG